MEKGFLVFWLLAGPVECHEKAIKKPCWQLTDPNQERGCSLKADPKKQPSFHVPPPKQSLIKNPAKIKPCTVLAPLMDREKIL